MAFKPLISVDPATGKVFKKFPQHSSGEVEKRMALCAKAFTAWREKSFAERAEALREAARSLRANKKELSKLAGSEMGKVQAAGEMEVEKCATTLEFYASEGEKMLSPESVNTEARESFVRFDPIGIVLAVMPWNFPFWQVVRAAAPALMAGNTMVLKHASSVQGCAGALEDIFNKAFPKGVFVNLAIESSRVEKLIRDERIAAVTLTGSEFAGSSVAKVAGEVLKKTVMELGGSDPFIVLEDADIDAAAEGAVIARMQSNVGQSCISSKRFIVHQKISKEFVEKVSNKMAALVVGNPADSGTQVGPMASEQMQLTIDAQVKTSVKKGAKIAAGGVKIPRKGFFYAPTVLTNVKKGMPAYDEEIFGPVLAVIVVKSKEEAVRVANDTIYGLGSSIFSRDVEEAKKIAARIEAGAVFINSVVRSDARLPFGGIKKSGYGRELSAYGIKEFVNVKTVYVK